MKKSTLLLGSIAIVALVVVGGIALSRHHMQGQSASVYGVNQRAQCNGTPPTFGYIAQWGTYGTGNEQFMSPRGLAFDSSGNIYVADGNNDRISEFTPGGVFLKTFGWGVKDGAHHSEICTSGTACQAGIAGFGNGQFDTPTAIAFDRSGNIFVTNYENNATPVQELSSSESYLNSFGYDLLNGPSGIATDSVGNIYAESVFRSSFIVKFNNSGSYLNKWGGVGPGTGQLNNPSRIALDSNGNLYVTDSNNNRISEFTSGGSFLKTFGWGVKDGSNQFEACTTGCQAGIAGSGDGQFNFPNGITFDSSGNIYVTDYKNNRVEVFSPSFTFLKTFGWGVQDGGNRFEACTANCQAGISGSGNGQFNNPADVIVDASGNVYVTDYTNNRVEKFGLVCFNPGAASPVSGTATSKVSAQNNNLGAASAVQSSGASSSASCAITSFTATPSTMTSGNSSTLAWTTTSECTGASITANPGTTRLYLNLPASGSVSSGKLYQSTVFTLSAQGNGGGQGAQIPVTVN